VLAGAWWVSMRGAIYGAALSDGKRIATVVLVADDRSALREMHDGFHATASQRRQEAGEREFALGPDCDVVPKFSELGSRAAQP
jgi:hypothetical protein